MPGNNTNVGKITPDVKYIIMMGDSLSDRGTLNKRLLCGCIPMSTLSGLSKTSPDGRFTNGLVWSDHVTANIASDFTIKRLEKRWSLDHTDIADAIIIRDKRILNAIFEGYALDDDKFVNYRSKVWVRSYCEGGLMSHDYSWKLSTSPTRFFTRLIVPSLADMRKKIEQYDIAKGVSYQHKAETLVVEWSGANDLVTVNAKPSLEEVDKAIIARMENVKKLIASGYRNFILFNLPNLAKTPRYQTDTATKEMRDLAEQCTTYFNSELEKACERLVQVYPHCAVEGFDIDKMFEKIYANPEQFYFDKDKLKTAYNTSVDFDDSIEGQSAASGYMFYDDLHPSADTHALLSSEFYDQMSGLYELLEPDKDVVKKRDELTEEQLLACFRYHYEQSLNKGTSGFFSCCCSAPLDYKNAGLEEILKSAIIEKSTRTRNVLMGLGWMSKEGAIILDSTILKNIEAGLYEHLRPTVV